MVKIKTNILKGMLSKAIKVCSFNKMVPLTEIIELRVKNNVLQIRTTDMITDLLLETKLDGEVEDMNVVVDATLLTQLINKTTSESVELILSDKSLTVVGNGVYNLDLRVDDSNQLIKFPDLRTVEGTPTDINFSELVEKLSICKSAIPDNLDSPDMNNYYISDTIVASNVFKITSVPSIEGLDSKGLLISKELGRILMDMNFAIAKVLTDDKTILIQGEGFTLTSKINEGIEKYNIVGLKSVLNTDFSNTIILDRKKLSDLLERLNLFVNEYENNSIYVNFGLEDVTIFNEKKTSKEIIKYNDQSAGITTFNCIISITHLKELLDVLTSSEIKIQFGGSQVAIKLVDGDIEQIVCLMKELVN